jgi:hypothetical protein
VVANVHDDENGNDWTFEALGVSPCKENELGQSVYDTAHELIIAERVTLRGTLPADYPATNLGATSYILRQFATEDVAEAPGVVLEHQRLIAYS